MDNPENSSFGDLLRDYRESTVDKRTRTRLSQSQFAEKLSKRMGLKITRNKVGYWETNKTVIPVQDRNMLLAILVLLHEYGGIANLEEANRFLEIGLYRVLTATEAREIDQNWETTNKNHDRIDSEKMRDDGTSQSSIFNTITTQISNIISKKTEVEIELYPPYCGNLPINLAQQRLLVSTSFGSYFTGLLERPDIYLDLDSQIDCPSTRPLEGLSPLQRIFWLLGYAKGPRTLVIGGEGGMGKSTLTAKIMRCLYQEGAIDLILGDSAKSRHIYPTSHEVIEYKPGYYDPSSFYNRLCSQLGLPSLPGKQAIEAFQDRLLGRRAIIVVDNLETVQQGDEILHSLKKITSRDVRAIVTTRKVLGVKALGEEQFVVQLQPLTEKRIAEQFLLWHVEQYQGHHPSLRDLRMDIPTHLDWLITRTGGIPLLMQLVLSDVARSSWNYVQTLPSLFGNELLNYLYQARWDELSQQNKQGSVAKQLLGWVAAEQYRGKEITSKEISSWAKSHNHETHLPSALSLLFERFMIVNQDVSKGNYSIYPSLAEFIDNQE
jgi:hypothetical protein